MKNLKKILSNIDYIISVTCLTVLIVITFVGVLSRYLLNSPFAWTEEVQMMLIVWAVFMGGSAAFREKAHIVIEVLVDALPVKVQKIVRMLVDAVTVVVLAYIGYQGLEYIGKQISVGRVTSILKIPGQFIYAIVPIGSVFMIANFLITEYRELFRNDVGGEES